jgi:hypothetical protein
VPPISTSLSLPITIIVASLLSSGVIPVVVIPTLSALSPLSSADVPEDPSPVPDTTPDMTSLSSGEELGWR